MKVLSLTEPYATLISENKKLIETRSWKTDYRGELYIHASVTKIPKEWKKNKELMGLVDNTSLNYGNIICKCNLVDCIYMTKDYVENMKKNNYQEYICGVYEEGRYAWILEDITPLKKSIKAKGRLNIWNYYNELEIMDLMDNIDYGWVSKEGEINYELDNFARDYTLQSPKETIKNKVGVCWDQVELERYYFKGNEWQEKTYYLVYHDKKIYPTHTFLTYKKDDKYYWFEHSWENKKGIHEYLTLQELLLDVIKKFIKDELHNQYKKENILLYQYKKPRYHISTEEFMNYCEMQELIKIDKL